MAGWQRARLSALLVCALALVAGPAVGGARAPARSHTVVLPNGFRMLTHGGDPRTADFLDPPGLTRATLAATAAADSTAADERKPVCATDYYQQFLYTSPAGLLGTLEQNRPVIQAAVRRMNFELNRDSIESGGPSADYKVLCDANGEIQVDTFLSAGVDFTSVTLAAQQAGYTKTNVDYTIFVDASWIYCGQGSFADDTRPGVENLNNTGLDYAVVWDGCWLGRTPMHENGHNQGAVQAGAPNSTGAGHCNDQQDVMCYSDGGPTDRGDFVVCDDRMRYDCGYDSYFDSAPERGEWLSDHWNIGSRVNRFIVFGRTRT
ncbi:MAG: hypothetical protein ABR520_01155 [Mycobacteriales bacterium]|nr:hypothetical protein [Frankia sp.]